jgi:hypothetical protein
MQLPSPIIVCSGGARGMTLAAQAAAASAGEVEARKQLPMKLTRLRGATHTQKRLRMKTVPSCGSKRRGEGWEVCVRSGCVCRSVCACVCVWRCEGDKGESCSPVRVWGLEPVFGWMWCNIQPPATHNSRNLRRKLRAQPEGREEQTSTAGQRDRAGNTKDFCGCDQEKRPPDEAPKAASAFWTAPTRTELNHSFITTSHTLHNFPNHFL